MHRQRDLFQNRPWRTIIVADAARADMTREIDPRYEPVISLACPTWKWCKQFWSLEGRDQVWITANPEPTHTLRREAWPDHVTMVDAWRDLWQEFGGPPQGPLGSVHPERMTDYVLDWVTESGQPERLVVFYLQPHAPFIFEPLPVAVGNIAQSPTGKNGGSVAQAIERGDIMWGDVRRSYRANLAGVLPEAERLAAGLDGLSIVTSDHGEALGEGGEFGHAGAHWRGLREVPYREVP